MGYGCKSARRSTTCVVIWCCINLAPRCGGLFRCTCGRMCLRREGAVCGSGMGAPIIALLLRRFCGEVGAPTAHVGARRGAVRGDNEAFQPSSSEPWENSPSSLRTVFLNAPLAPATVRPPGRGDPLDPAGVPHGFRKLSVSSFQLFTSAMPSTISTNLSYFNNAVIGVGGDSCQPTSKLKGATGPTNKPPSSA